jgi:two-component sensor histidine kinase
MRSLPASSCAWCLRALALLLLACQSAPPATQEVPGLPQAALATRFRQLLQRGDSVYAEKKGYRSFTRAQLYYDSARTLADRSGDTLLLAEAVFAKARVYDAWNQQPRQTVAAFQEAARLFARRPAAWRRYFYARYLVAHAYDKIPDSLRTVQSLRQLRTELLVRPDSVRRQVPTTVEMALTATEVHNYPLADSLLRQLVRRPDVRNDPETYNYLDHYFLTQARLDVYQRRPARSAYLDSLQAGYASAGNAFDRLYYGLNLADLYAAAGHYAPAYRYLRLSQNLSDSLNNGGDSAQLRQTLVQAEERAARRRRQDEAARQRLRTWGLWGLSAGLAVITLLSAYLYAQQRRSRQQTRALARANNALAETNAQLDKQVEQVALLNKEIQHRVKNNLHMVYSLLQMQERRTDNEEVIEHLQAARLRVESIAALHNQLLHNPDTVPDLTLYLKGLISSVVSCLANDRQVVTHLQTMSLRLPANSYLPLSLILNEWVTNSIKYATPREPVLEIIVALRHKPGETCLTYADNGRPPDADAPPALPGLGTQLIALLTRQLGAILHTPANQPYLYELCFPTPHEPLV